MQRVDPQVVSADALSRVPPLVPQSAPRAADRLDLTERISDVEARLSGLLLDGGTFVSVYRHVLSARGKRLRAQMVLATAAIDVPAPTIADVIDSACVVEMLHEASLIHDDICDGSLTRRGQPSVAARFGVRAAAHAGFYLAGTALDIAANVVERVPDAHAALTTGPRHIASAIGPGALSFGQLLECLPPKPNPDALRRHYRTVALAKTGTLFRLACAMGAALAQCDADERFALMAYADRLAVAFQIMDDVRDVEGAADLGKRGGTDAARHVLTWPVIEWLAISPLARDRWEAVGMNGGDLAEIAQLCDDIAASGGTGRARDEATRMSRAAEESLRLVRPCAATRYLSELCALVVAS